MNNNNNYYNCNNNNKNYKSLYKVARVKANITIIVAILLHQINLQEYKNNPIIIVKSKSIHSFLCNNNHKCSNNNNNNNHHHHHNHHSFKTNNPNNYYIKIP